MNTLKKLAFTTAMLLCSASGFAQVGINTTTPNAQLDVKSSNQAAPSNTDGMLIPKIDTFPAVNPGAAQQGMLVYLTTAVGSNNPGFYYWDNTTSAWIGIDGSTKGWELSGNAGTNPTTNFIGTTDNQGLAFKTNNAERFRITNTGFAGFGTSTPQTALHVYTGASGFTPNPFSTATLESTQSSYLSLLSTQETGLIFSGGANATDGSIVYNNPFLPNGLSFRTKGNITRVNIADNGNMALGPFVPQYPLQFQNTVGDKISLWGNTWNHYGFGIQNDLLQIHTNGGGADVAFGWGSSAAFTETMRIKGTGNVGIGTTTPLSKLHVWKGNSGMTPNAAAGLAVEGTGFTYMNVLSDSETGVLFGSNGFHTNGGIVYNSGIYTNGMNFRTGGNINRMNISSVGNVSIGDVLADARLHIVASNAAAPANNDGIIIPRVSNFPAVNPTAAQNGMMIFLTTAVGTKPRGFYFWDHLSLGWHGVSAPFAWGMTGNSGTTPTNNFIGTTDNQDLIFRRNNLRAGQLGANNTSFGNNAMAANTTGIFNVGIGLNALAANNSGAGNVAVGANALSSNTASGIVGIGDSALFQNTSGQFNTAVGSNAARTGSTANCVTSMGYNSLFHNTASFNTAYGVNALSNNSTGEWNVAVGIDALKANTIGHHNTAMGDAAMNDNVNGEQNTAVGHRAMAKNVSGGYNTAVGMNALHTNQAGISNTVLGTGAMYWHANGDNNTAIGMEAMNNQTMGSNNIAIGKGANVPNLTGSDQLSIGNVIYGTGTLSPTIVKIGIADSAPDARLEISATSVAAPSNFDGILIPRINTFPVANPTAAQNGMLVFLNNASGLTPAGFYYWDNATTNWVGVGTKNNWSSMGNYGMTSSNYIGTNDANDVSLRANGAEVMRLKYTGNTEISGYTELGSTAPAIKMAKLTGTTSGAQGGTVTIAHGVANPSKILSVSIHVEYISGSSVPADYNINPGYEFTYYINGGNIVIFNKASNSANILSKPIRVLVTYEQ